MTFCVFAIPGDLATPTGGYAYARKILPFLQDTMAVRVCTLPAGFPFPSEEELQETGRTIADANGIGGVLLADGLAYGAFPASLIEKIKYPIIALVHHPLGLEEGVSTAEKALLLASERTALEFARHIVVTSPATARTLSEIFGVGPAKITVAEPGVLAGAQALGASQGEPLHIVSVGTITPRKGFDVLVEALHAVRDLGWRTTIAGALDRSPETVSALKEKIARLGLSDRVQLAGSLDEASISALYRSGDVFALSSLYEGYGMAFAEAMAHGLPVVASGGGAVRDTVPDDAGFVCAAGDVSAISNALRLMLSNPVLRKRKAQSAWSHAQGLPTWKQTAALIAEVLLRNAK